MSITVDIALRLKLYRERSGLSQKDVAQRSGLGEKTISSYETSKRVGSMKLTHLTILCAVYGVSVTTFLEPTNPIDARDVPIDAAPDEATNDAIAGRDLPRLGIRREREPHDPLRGFVSGVDSRYPSPQSALSSSFVGAVSLR
jgi:transcriptional regulator with XRE-family HTH domain